MASIALKEMTSNLGHLSNFIWRQHPFVSSVILAISEAEYLTSLETKVLPEMVKHRRFEKMAILIYVRLSSEE